MLFRFIFVSETIPFLLFLSWNVFFIGSLNTWGKVWDSGRSWICYCVVHYKISLEGIISRNLLNSAVFFLALHCLAEVELFFVTSIQSFFRILRGETGFADVITEKVMFLSSETFLNSKFKLRTF